jgi:HlyD family secretion protein
VEVEKEPFKFEKRVVQTGISDGIQIEILKGLEMKDKIKVAQVIGEVAKKPDMK